MTPPTSYTETSLAQYVLDELGTVATVLGWTATSSVSSCVDDALLEMDVSDISTVTEAEDIRWLRAVAKYYGWRKAVANLSTKYDFSTGDSGSFKRSQMHAAARASMELAREEANEAAIAAGQEMYPGYEVGTVTLVQDDPYSAEYLDTLMDALDELDGD
ncbi:MAG: hypothetical protein ACOYYS_10000 [Chloroflexota bacterium]